MPVLKNSAVFKAIKHVPLMVIIMIVVIIIMIEIE